MELILFSILFTLFVVGGIYNSIRAMDHTYDKDISAALQADKQGWELISVRHPTSEEYYDSPYYSFFRLKISGVRSAVLIATIQKEERTVELWVQVHTFLFWVTSVGYEPKKKNMSGNKLTQEQWERLL